MDYEKKYKVANDKVAARFGTNVAKEIFADLYESDDERIRKYLIRYIDNTMKSSELKSKLLAWLEKQGEPLDKGETSDGFHTFNELYYYRMLYNAAFFNMLPKEWVHKSKKHNDGEECFGGGWFIVMANLPTGQISNHYELKDWDLFQIPEKERADKWDGHTPQEAAERLHKFLLEKQGEQKPTDNKGMNIDEEFINALGTMLNDGLPDRYLVSEERIKKSAELLFSIARKQLKNEMQEWSEEDESLRLRTIGALETCKIGSPTKCVDEQINWLKSLRLQNRWKPSDEQMNALSVAVKHGQTDDPDALKKLLEQLKKLREE